jgi:hypothetical protein
MPKRIQVATVVCVLMATALAMFVSCYGAPAPFCDRSLEEYAEARYNRYLSCLNQENLVDCPECEPFQLCDCVCKGKACRAENKRINDEIRARNQVKRDALGLLPYAMDCGRGSLMMKALERKWASDNATEEEKRKDIMIWLLLQQQSPGFH